MNTEQKKELAKRFNISLPTYYSWEKNKPELIKIIELGLMKEKELEENLDGFEDLGNVVKKMYDEMQDMKKKMEELESK
ncbi:TetR/AcrR family transcriptional regulator [Arcobacter arenosus]|uniref:TetR/AcrR family transcriptional regulator n=1 Tax=Arcobacter arenosus TaxID=2576037 RepID=A0A5R8XYX0_9BACT|nr:TetR/AcrR family transcriptional regulator [Arcobacter arenosus]TLP36941.1 TetR/AcrR family transcriptional regulator [Arcobacter arenosus]